MTTKDNPPESREELEQVLKFELVLKLRKEKTDLYDDRAVSAVVAPTVNKILALLDLQKQQLLDAVEKAGPGNEYIRPRSTNYGKVVDSQGFNRANDQWRTAINKLRKGLGESK